jgi:Mrp family chromosome partitioning ATPase
VSIGSSEQVALLTDYDPQSAYSQAYYTLYANIRFSWDSEKSKQHTVLLTTPSAAPVQATIAANVAIAAAQSGTSTVLVDANLRAPELEQRFGLGKGAGLYELLAATEPLSTQKIVSYLQATFIPGLRLLSAGNSGKTSEEANLLSSVQLEDVVRCLRAYLAETETQPGIVIFHSAAVLSGPDASCIGALVDQTILAIAKGRTTRTSAKQAQEQLQRAHVQLTGIVLLEM